MNATVDKPARPPTSRLKKFLWITGLVGLSLGGAYLGGRLQSQARIDALDRELSVARGELAELKGKETLQLQQLGELEARRQIHLALLAFDDNNFGIARDNLRKAATLLESPSTGTNPALAQLGVALRTLELSPTLDLTSQRAAIVQLTTKFDGLRPPRPLP